jgi:hypothetical protein
MSEMVSSALSNVHPQMLRASSPATPQRSGDDYAREIGAAFEWALDRARVTKQEAAYRMGYSDSGVIGRWISGRENLQIHKTRLIGDAFFQEFVVALAQTCGGVEVKTLITLARVG